MVAIETTPPITSAPPTPVATKPMGRRDCALSARDLRLGIR